MDRPGQARITRLITPPRAGACLVGFSGGLDSTVLLHLLASDADARHAGLRAIHVHHGLHADADAWAAHCQRVCDALGVALSIAHVDVDRASGLGLEGAARDARHRAFAQALADDEILAFDASGSSLVHGTVLTGGLLQAVAHATAKAGMFMAAGLVYVLVAVIWLVPDRRIERVLHDA